jgi:GTP-binding protein HflX
VLVEDALFATLDPTTRRSTTPDGRPLTLTDTVGFVRHLPHQLVEAFRSTLEEVAQADLLLHVVDGTDPMPERQVEAVREVLAEVVREQDVPMPAELLVVNKADAADELALARLRHLLGDAVFVSARTGAGIAELAERIGERLPRPEAVVEILVPYARGEVVSRVHAEGEVLTEEHTAEGTRLRARVRPNLAGVLERFAANGSPL